MIFVLGFLPPTYSVIDLHIRAEWALMNESGVVAGTMSGSGSQFFWKNGKTTLLPGSVTKICGLNRKGQIAIETREGQGLWEKGKVTIISTSKENLLPLGVIAGIDDRGTMYGELATGSEGAYRVATWPDQKLGIVPRPGAIGVDGSIAGTFGWGQLFQRSDRPLAWLWQPGKPNRPIGDSDHQCIPSCMSPNHRVGGYFTSKKDLLPLPFAWSDGNFVELPIPHDQQKLGKVSAIDDRGNAVGQCSWQENTPHGLDGVAHGVLWRDGEFFDLNDLVPKDSPFVVTNALGIDRSGQILALTQPKDRYVPSSLVLLKPNRR